MKSCAKISLLLGVAIVLLAAGASANAQEGGSGEAPACPDLGSPPPSTSSTTPPFRCDDSTVFRCTNNACGKDGGAITQGTQSYQCVITTFCFGVVESSGACPAWTTRCSSSRSRVRGPLYDNEHQASVAGKYQTCPASGNAWSANPPAYQCAGQCYPAPNITPLKEVKTPKNVFDKINLKLPVHLEWGDNVEKELAKPESENKNPKISFCSVESYTYKLSEQGASPLLEKEVQTSNRSVIPFPDECKMQPNTPYDFQVQACLQGVCGDPGELQFTTSTAPQLLSPYDPDWEEEKSGRTPFPAEFKWCEHPDSSVKSYALNAYEAKEDGSKGAQVLLTGTSSRKKITYSDSSLLGGLNRLGRGASYFWEIGACTDSGAKQCGIFSQLWKVVPGGELKAPPQLFPADGAFVNMTDILQWQQVVFATHYVVHIQGGSLNKDFFTQGMLSLQSIWQELALTTAYTWKVAPCGGPPTSTDLKDCENDNKTIPWSKEQRFITTGAQPQGFKIAPTEAGVAGIPLTLDWDDMGGAASYEITISPSSTPRVVSEKSETTLQYPAVKTKTSYSFAVKTCADKLAKVCGPEASGSFTTVALASPPLTDPPLGQKDFDPSTGIAWNKVFSGNFYSYTLAFLSPSSQEVSPECARPYQAAHGITQESSATVRFRCLGGYSLALQACIDKECKETGSPSTFSLTVEKLLAPSGGLVPCDRGNDDTNTKGVDERKPCGIEHVFLLIRNIIDFALWKLSLVIVIFMVIATGAIMFFSFGGPDVMTKIRGIWRSVGIGVFILLFSWLFLNILLDLVGFNVNVFGHWYDLPSLKLDR